MTRPVWFEIPADDTQRAVRFYHDVFGWEISQLADWGDYWIARLPQAANSTMGGAIMSRSMGACTRNTIDVPSLDEALPKVEQAGGKIVSERMPIPHGTFIVCADTEGNEFGLMEAEPGEAPPPPPTGASAMLNVVHFDLPADDVQRAIAFYESVFGWKIATWEGPMEYWLVDTGPETEPGIHGGLSARQDRPCPMNTIMVPDVEEYRRKVEAAGGSIMMPKAEIPGVGWMAACTDTEGNAFGILQPM